MPPLDQPVKPIRLLAGLWLAGAVLAVVVGGFLPRWWIAYLDGISLAPPPGELDMRAALMAPGVLGSLRFYGLLQAAAAFLGILCMVRATFGRSRGALRATHASFAITYFVILVLWLGLGDFLDNAHGARLPFDPTDKEAVIGGLPGRDWFFSWATGGPFLAIAAVVVAHVLCSTGPVYAYHGEELPGDAPGDRLIEFVRSGGKDPIWARSWWASLSAFLLLIFGDFLLNLIVGCYSVEDYKLPPGSGKPSTPQVTAQKIVKKKRFILAKNSIYIFKDPTPQDSKVIKKIDKISQRIYDATASGTPGAHGVGGGDEGGFGGPPGGELGFIRLQYSCHKWDDGMTAATGNADRNFLKWWQDLPNVNYKVRQRGESHPIGALAYYTPGLAPPFVYMTGEGRGRGISSKDIKVLKDYLKDGGLLLVDAGSREFHRWFTSWVRNLTGGRPLTTISDDDPIFSICYPMNNIMPLHPHGGRQQKAMGFKYQKRWIIFYHPGDMNDAWKDNAYKEPKRIRDNAKRTAYNVIYYAIINYINVNRKHLSK